MLPQFERRQRPFKVDRRAIRVARLKTRQGQPPRASLPRPRDQPVSPDAILIASARDADCNGSYGFYPPRAVLRNLAYCCWERSNLLNSVEAPPYAAALVSLGAHCRDWIRPLDTWHPAPGPTDCQFGSLLRHLFGRYDVPSFMDAAWRLGLTAEGLKQQTWFKLIGSGQSMREGQGLPVPLTKRMAAHFLQAPSDFNIPAAFRYSQVVALGGDERLTRALLATRIGTSFHANDFWETVIRWLIKHPQIETIHHGPIIDYLYDQRFVPSDPGLRRGCPRLVPPQPNLCMKGRTAGSVLRAVTRWHKTLWSKRPPFACWNVSGIPPLLIAEQLESGGKTYAITELVSAAELQEEGIAMNHCVANYALMCRSGETSIWSLTMEDAVGQIQRLLTLQVQNRRREIVQARGRFNRMPEPDEGRILSQWARAGGACVSQELLGLMTAQ